jgi:hypothetical protein
MNKNFHGKKNSIISIWAHADHKSFKSNRVNLLNSKRERENQWEKECTKQTYRLKDIGPRNLCHETSQVYINTDKSRLLSFNPRHVLQVQILHRANKKEGEKNSAKRGPLLLRNQKTLTSIPCKKRKKENAIKLRLLIQADYYTFASE